MATADDPDVELMLAVQRGDRAAFDRLFDRHIGAVIGFATRFVGTRARAEELAQDVFLQLYKTRARYVPRARFSTWLYRMVTNACLSEVRRAEHRTGAGSRTASRDEASDEMDAMPDPVGRSSEDSAVAQETLEQLRELLAELPAAQRAALLLSRVEGFSYDEVAASMGCSVSAVKSLVHRATVTLRNRMHGEGS